MATSSHSPDVASGWLELSDQQTATTHGDSQNSANRLGKAIADRAELGTAPGPETPTHRVSHDQRTPVQTSANHRGPRGVLTSRGAFALILFATSAACIAGFVMTSAAVIPAIAGWSLAISSLAAATVIRERDKLMAVWIPPLVMALVIAVLGQITLLGTSPTIAREISMFLAAMASAAPAQVVAVGGAFLILRWRFPKNR